MKTVIRIEHPNDGKGLWRSTGCLWPRISSHSQYSTISNRHHGPDFPTLVNDKELFRQVRDLPTDELESYHFAFKSLEQLATALTNDELKECINVLGFRVLMLDVSHYYESDYQVIFKKENITESKDISFMFI